MGIQAVRQPKGQEELARQALEVQLMVALVCYYWKLQQQPRQGHWQKRQT